MESIFFFDRHEQDNNDRSLKPTFSTWCTTQSLETSTTNSRRNSRKKSTKAFIPADKTSNFYKLDKTQHDKLLTNSITTTYKKASKDATNIIDLQAKSIAQELNIDNRTVSLSNKSDWRQCIIMWMSLSLMVV